MMLITKRKFLFRCEECGTIVSAEFDEQDAVKKVEEDKVILECPCGGPCQLLRD